MTIIYPLDLPLEFVQGLRVGEVNASSFRRSPFTGRGEPQIFEGDYWTLEIDYRNLNRSQSQPVLAFRSALRGSAGTFISIFPGYPGPLGAAKDNPSTLLVRADVVPGTSTLPIKEAPNNIDGFFLAGDILQVGPADRPHWHRVLADVDTDSIGTADIDVWPLIREGATRNDPVESENPLCLFRQTGEIDTDIEPPVLHSLTIVAEEDT